jgi:spore coat protein U-like protein
MHFTSLKAWIILICIIIWTPSVNGTCLGLGCTCIISATNVSFGTYNPISGLALNSTGTVSVTCSALVLGLAIAYQMQLSTGGSGSFSRYMASGINHLNYNLYTDSARTQIWGDGTASTVTVSDNYLLTISPTTRNYTAFGLVPASQNLPTGSYSDTITATVIF